MSLLPAFLEEAGDNEAALFYLSGETLAAFRLAHAYLSSLSTWQDYKGEIISPADRDEIDRIVDNAIWEINNPVMMPVGAFNVPQLLATGMRAVGETGAPTDNVAQAAGQITGILVPLVMTVGRVYQVKFFIPETFYYVFRWWGAVNTASIRADWTIDGLPFVTNQNWNAAAVLNSRFDSPPTLIASGLHTLELSRNPASAGGSNVLRLSLIEIFPSLEEEGGGH